MTKPLILVTGATGKTGRPVVEQLLVHGYPVRALVHRVDERSRQLSELGAEVVVGDFHDLPSLRAAMKGIERAYFCYPPQGGRLLEAAAEDIARVVVAILVDPAPHVGRRYVITGSEDMTLAEMAEVLTAELGKPVEYVHLPIEEWRTLLVEKAGFPEFLTTHLAAAAQDHRDGLFCGATNVVETITGRPPQSLTEFIRTHESEFSRGRASARAA